MESMERRPVIEAWPNSSTAYTSIIVTVMLGAGIILALRWNSCKWHQKTFSFLSQKRRLTAISSVTLSYLSDFGCTPDNLSDEILRDFSRIVFPPNSPDHRRTLPQHSRSNVLVFNPPKWEIEGEGKPREAALDRAAAGLHTFEMSAYLRNDDATSIENLKSVMMSKFRQCLTKTLEEYQLQQISALIKDDHQLLGRVIQNLTVNPCMAAVTASSLPLRVLQPKFVIFLRRPKRGSSENSIIDDGADLRVITLGYVGNHVMGTHPNEKRTDTVLMLLTDNLILGEQRPDIDLKGSTCRNVGNSLLQSFRADYSTRHTNLSTIDEVALRLEPFLIKFARGEMKLQDIFGSCEIFFSS